jgi:hypothetical protein
MEPLPLPSGSHSWLVARHPDGRWESLLDLLPGLLARLEAEGITAVHDDALEGLSPEASEAFAAVDIRGATRWGRSSEGPHAYFVEVDSYWLGP